jgi:dGTPase
LFLNKNPHLESQIAAISDDVAYNNHDIEDAIRAGLISIDSLKDIYYFKELIEELYIRYPNIEENLLIYQVLRMSISKMINDIIAHSSNLIEQLNINSVEDVRNCQNFLISMSDTMKNHCLEISTYLFKNVYNHPKLLKKRSNAENIIFKIFEYFDQNFNKLPNDWLFKSKIEEKHRVICDYISGMTDRYASKLYKSIYD